jgi:hypothetical protein
MIKRIRPDQLVQPWQLDADWMERLEVPERLRRHYFHLSLPERMKLEGDRQLIEHYSQRGLLQDGRTKESLIGRMSQELDRSWLQAGKGRAVDFKQALQVLEIYAAYHAWATTIPHNRAALLDVILPYSYNGGIPLIAGGFLRIQIEVASPLLGKVGDVQWSNGHIELTELRLVNNRFWMPPSQPFDKGTNLQDYPFCFLDIKQERRWGGWRSDSTAEQYSLIGYLGVYIRDVCGRGKRKESLFQLNFTPPFVAEQNPSESLCCLSFSNPTAHQLQEFLNGLAQRHFDVKTPPNKDWQLQFDVAHDLTSITTASIFKGHSVFGCFYQERTKPLNK